jgi:hypothetical protein
MHGSEPGAERADVVVVGAGAAGLMAAVWAGRGAPGARVVAVDGAKRLGAKILVAGGGRCNVTHHAVDETAYAGSSRNAIKNVLRSFGVPETVEFFRRLGVQLKREETGKLFPTTDRAQTVLDALLLAARQAGAEVRHPWRVAGVRAVPGGFVVTRDAALTGTGEAGNELFARRVVLCTGGKALPKSGSDGLGYALAAGFGHTVTERVFPALVPLETAGDFFGRGLSGVATPVVLTVESDTGKRLAQERGPMLLTHFGVSGPAVLDVSRHYLDAKGKDAGARLLCNWLPATEVDALDRQLAGLRTSPGRLLMEAPHRLPERLARGLCDAAGIDASARPDHLTREARRAFVQALCRMALPVTGDRGFDAAEVTAGGVPLSEVRLETMESRRRPGLHLAGEILDVDGRVGGFNFQWAWASGRAAGMGAAAGLREAGEGREATTPPRPA